MNRLRIPPPTFRISLQLSFLIILTACASTRLKSTWKDPAYSFGGIRKILVMGVGPQESIQRVLEDAFVQNLAKKGAQGVPSYSLSPASAKLDEAGWKRLVAENHFDAVMVTRLVDLKTVEREVPPTTTTVAVGGPPPMYNNGGFIGGGSGNYNAAAYNSGAYNAGWYGYYQSNYQVMTTPGYTVKDQYAVIDTKVFDVAGGKMVWTANSETQLGPGQDSNALARQFAQIVTETIYKP